MPPSDLGPHVAGLNDWYRLNSATTVMRHALTSQQVGRLALVSSFGAESVVLLHMMSVIDRNTPVIFLDTELLFTETLVYQQELAERLGLRDLRIVRSAQIAAQDPDAILHKTDPDACCALRKARPLQEALEGFDGWITGRKRYQGGARETLEFFETEDGAGNKPARMKVNPLAHWRREDVQTYMTENNLPRHPLVAKGYPSIGCIPCTSPVAPDEDPRAGRWRGAEKTECGIHFVDGKLIKQGANA